MNCALRFAVLYVIFASCRQTWLLINGLDFLKCVLVSHWSTCLHLRRKHYEFYPVQSPHMSKRSKVPHSLLEDILHSCSFPEDLESFEHAVQENVRLLFGEVIYVCAYKLNVLSDREKAM